MIKIYYKCKDCGFETDDDFLAPFYYYMYGKLYKIGDPLICKCGSENLEETMRTCCILGAESDREEEPTDVAREKIFDKDISKEWRKFIRYVFIQGYRLALYNHDLDPDEEEASKKADQWENYFDCFLLRVKDYHHFLKKYDL